MRDSIRLFFIVSLKSVPAFAGFDEPPQTLAQEPQQLRIFIVGLALFLGLLWILSSINSRNRASRRRFRHDRIRELEAKLRVSQGDTKKSRNEVESLKKELKETIVGLVRRDNLIYEQQSNIKRIQSDLKYSVIKTRELRAELAERAVQIIHAEARIRQFETGLSVAHASNDIICSTCARLR